MLPGNRCASQSVSHILLQGRTPQHDHYHKATRSPTDGVSSHQLGSEKEATVAWGLSVHGATSELTSPKFHMS